MASVPVWVAQNSSTSLLAMLWRFSSSTSFRSSAPSCPRRASARAATWRTRSSLSPLQARVSSARIDGSRGEPLLRLMLLSRLRRSSASGSGRSSSVRASSRSAGGFQLPLHSTRVWVVLRRLWCRLRSILATPGSSQKRWKSFSSRMVGLALSRSRSHCSTAIGWRLPVPSALSTPWSPSMKSQLARRCRSCVAVCRSKASTLASSLLRIQIRAVLARIIRSSCSLQMALLMVVAGDEALPSEDQRPRFAPAVWPGPEPAGRGSDHRSD